MLKICLSAVKFYLNFLKINMNFKCRSHTSSSSRWITRSEKLIGTDSLLSGRQGEFPYAAADEQILCVT